MSSCEHRTFDVRQQILRTLLSHRFFRFLSTKEDRQKCWRPFAFLQMRPQFFPKKSRISRNLPKSAAEMFRLLRRRRVPWTLNSSLRKIKATWIARNRILLWFSRNFARIDVIYFEDKSTFNSRPLQDDDDDDDDDDYFFLCHVCVRSF